MMGKSHFLKIFEFLLTAISIVVVSVVLTACDKGSDGTRRGDTPQNPAERPDPIGGKWDFDAELRDSSPRFEGGDISMRFDRTGILVRYNADGTGAFIELDGGRKADFCVGGMQADSVCRGAWISVDGQRLSGLTVRLKKQTADAAWYHVESQTPAGGYMLVIPR